MNSVTLRWGRGRCRCANHELCHSDGGVVGEDVLTINACLTPLIELKAGQAKMSKSDPDSAIFMEDSVEDVKRKITAAYCPRAAADVRCAFSHRNLHSRMPLDPTPVRLKRACM
jgi:hypothetical protein